MIVVEAACPRVHAGRIGPVHHDVRVHVAVAGVADHADDDAVLGGDPRRRRRAARPAGTRGTATSSMISAPSRSGYRLAASGSIAGWASRRAASSASASAASVAAYTSTAPLARQASAIAARSAGARAPVSTAASSRASASVGSPIGRYASIARRCTWSSSSSRLGDRPGRAIAATAAPAGGDRVETPRPA